MLARRGVRARAATAMHGPGGAVGVALALVFALALVLATRAAADPPAAVAGAIPPGAFDEAGLRAADREQLRILVEGDLEAQAALLHPNFVLNGDGSRILRRRQSLERMARTPQPMDRFERSIEAVTISDGVGVVTGTELVLGAPGSDLRVRYGDAVLERRFTNVYVYSGERWRLLARQSTGVRTAPVAPARKLLLGTGPTAQ